MSRNNAQNELGLFTRLFKILISEFVGWVQSKGQSWYLPCPQPFLAGAVFESYHLTARIIESWPMVGTRLRGFVMKR
jgi:hypothetical protein